MTLDELKSIATSGEMGEILSNLAPEILALVEAANKWQDGAFYGGSMTPTSDLEQSIEAFNAKLESL